MKRIGSYLLTSALLANVYFLPAQAQNRSSKLDQLNGIWEGTYVCRQGLTGLRLVIEAKSENQVYAVFNFFPHPSNPSVPSGSFRMEGTYTSFTSSQIPDVLKLKGTSWIDRSSGYNTVDLEASVNLAQGKLDGQITTSGCSTVSLTKVRRTNRDNSNRSLLGRWSGTMTQNSAPTSWNLQLNIAKNNIDGSFTGQSSKQPLTGSSDRISVSHDIEGNLSGETFNFKELRIIRRVAPSNWHFCNIQGQLQVSNENGSDVLRGPWECFYQGQRYYGEIMLQRQN